MALVEHLENSIWTLELEHALEVFSLSTYLNWLDYDFEYHNDDGFSRRIFPKEFLHYLKSQVSKPSTQTKLQLQLLILNRESLTFITTTCWVTRSILTPSLPSTIPQLERNSAS